MPTTNECPQDLAQRLTPDTARLTGKFHAHFTIIIAPEALDGLRDTCRALKLKLTVVDLEHGGRSQRDVMVTSYHIDRIADATLRICAALDGLAQQLECAGFNPVRVKLEHTSEPSISRFNDRQYHEVHIKTALAEQELEHQRQTLHTIATAHGFRCSRNPLERSSGRVFIFANARVRSGTRTQADDKVQEMLNGLTAAGIEVVETKQETVVFDTDRDVDRWWA